MDLVLPLQLIIFSSFPLYKADTKPLACILLSLEAVFPAAFQLAMDMLSRYVHGSLLDNAPNYLLSLVALSERDAFTLYKIEKYKYFIFYIFFRLKTSGEEITEILLSKGKVISALLYANNQGMERQIPARKFLQVNVVTCLCGLTENLFGSGNGNNFLSLFFQVAKETGNSEMFSYTRNWLEKQNLLSAKDAHDYPAPEL